MVEPASDTLERYWVKHFDVAAKAPHYEPYLFVVPHCCHVGDSRPDPGQLFDCVVIILIELINHDIVMELTWLVLLIRLESRDYQHPTRGLVLGYSYACRQVLLFLVDTVRSHMVNHFFGTGLLNLENGDVINQCEDTKVKRFVILDSHWVFGLLGHGLLPQRFWLFCNLLCGNYWGSSREPAWRLSC